MISPWTERPTEVANRINPAFIEALLRWIEASKDTKAGQAMMSPWTERPTEVANLLNPAFVGALLRTAVEGYIGEAASGMPFEVAFLVLPFCLHTSTAS